MERVIYIVNYEFSAVAIHYDIPQRNFRSVPTSGAWVACSGRSQPSVDKVDPSPSPAPITARCCEGPGSETGRVRLHGALNVSRLFGVCVDLAYELRCLVGSVYNRIFFWKVCVCMFLNVV